ncbi:ribonuclease HII [Candidatus Saccharibacteria bacterium]|nr:ribonuclease HII [Candidatus Saccharibacteria bacterium]
MAILGIDEVGRGPLAGPLVVGAVVLPEANGAKPEWVEKLRDSKKLTAKRREALSEAIWKGAPAVGLGWVSPKELDEVGISEALKMATRRAVESVQQSRVPFSQIIIDGKVNFLSSTDLGKYVSVMPKADDLVKEVSAASIVAKVARDAYMIEAGARFPEYGFEKHMGYGTLVHREAILKLGVCPEHRRSFEPIKSMVGFSRSKTNVVKNTTFVGAMGEDAVMSYLLAEEHKIVARNFKTYFYEIDIVSVCDGKIYFTEVKYRKNANFGGGVAAIDRRKLKRMEYAAECFLRYYKHEFDKLDPLLAVADVVGEDFEVRDWFALG